MKQEEIEIVKNTIYSVVEGHIHSDSEKSLPYFVFIVKKT